MARPTPGSTPTAAAGNGSSRAIAQPAAGPGTWPAAAVPSSTTRPEGAAGEGLYTPLRCASGGLERAGPGQATRAVGMRSVRAVLVGLRGAGAAVRGALLARVVPSGPAMLRAALGPGSSCGSRAGSSSGGPSPAAESTWWCSLAACTATGRQLLFRLAQLRAVPALGPAQWGGAWGDGGDGTVVLGGQERARAALVAGWSGACMAAVDLALGAAAYAALTAHADGVAASLDQAVGRHTDAVADGVRCVRPVRIGSRRETETETETERAL